MYLETCFRSKVLRKAPSQRIEVCDLICRITSSEVVFSSTYTCASPLNAGRRLSRRTSQQCNANTASATAATPADTRRASPFFFPDDFREPDPALREPDGLRTFCLLGATTLSQFKSLLFDQRLICGQMIAPCDTAHLHSETLANAA